MESLKRGAACTALVLAVGLAGAASCGGGEGSEPLYPLLTVMYEMDAYKRDIEPHIRNPDRAPQMAEAARKILEWTEYPSYANYTESAAFRGKNKELFQTFREELRRAIEAFAASADQGDLEAMSTHFTAMTSSCTACHKRFDPTY